MLQSCLLCMYVCVVLFIFNIFLVISFEHTELSECDIEHSFLHVWYIDCLSVVCFG